MFNVQVQLYCRRGRLFRYIYRRVRIFRYSYRRGRLFRYI